MTRLKRRAKISPGSGTGESNLNTPDKKETKSAVTNERQKPMMKRNTYAQLHFPVLLLALLAPFFCMRWSEQATAHRSVVYYLAPGDKWERKKPEQVGLNPALLAEAIEFAKQQKEPKTIAEVIAARQ